MHKFAIKVGILGQITLLIVILVLTTTISATQINVPADYATIQAAINASSSGDTIFVSPGTYVENINFLGKNILLKSTGGQSVTTIVPADTLAAVISFVSGESRAAVIDGFHIVATLAHDGFFLENSSPVITNCRIDNCRIAINATASSPSLLHSQVNCSSLWPAVRIMESQPDSIQLIANSISNALSDAINIDHTSSVRIVGNFIHDSKGGIFATRLGAGSLIVRNVVCRTSDGSGIYVADGGLVDVSNNTCYGNAVGITISQSTYTEVTGLDNIIVNSSAVGLYDAAHHIHNTLLWNNTTNFANPPQLTSDYVVADPMFGSVANGDFSLWGESPAIDVGRGDILDPDGSLPDLGALPSDHRLNTQMASDFRILGEDLLQVFSPNPVFAWSLDTTSVVKTIFDTVSCEVNPLDPSDTIHCIFVYSEIHSGGSQQAFEFQVGDDPDWGTAELLSTGEVSGNDSAFVYTGAALHQGHQYYARLHLKTQYGWGRWRNLVFKRNGPPATPALVFPTNNVRVNATKVVLRTDRLVDLDGDPVLCEIQLFDDTLSAAPLFSTSVAQELNSGVVTDTVAGLVAGTTYYWRARANDGTSYSAWSTYTWFRAVSPGKLYFPRDYALFQTAVALAIDGDSIMISPGSYQMANANLQQKSLTIIGTGGADSTTLQTTTNSQSIFVGLADRSGPTSFVGLHFVAGGSAFRGAGELLVRNCRFTKTGNSGIVLSSNANLVVDHSDFEYMAGSAIQCLVVPGTKVNVSNSSFHTDGTTAPFAQASISLFLESGAYEIVIRNNLFRVPESFIAIKIQGTPTGAIENNTILGYEHGIATVEPTGLSIRNNIFTGCSEYALHAPSANADYNCYWNNALNYSETTPGAHDLIADPLFVDAANGDYHLQCASPCIDAGDPASTGCIGKHRDIGIFEYAYKVGNANGNASGTQINMTDIVYLINYIFLGGQAPCPIGAGKVDCNEFVSVSDAIYLLNYLFAHGPAPCTGCP